METQTSTKSSICPVCSFIHELFHEGSLVEPPVPELETIKLRPLRPAAVVIGVGVAELSVSDAVNQFSR